MARARSARCRRPVLARTKVPHRRIRRPTPLFDQGRQEQGVLLPEVEEVGGPHRRLSLHLCHPASGAAVPLILLPPHVACASFRRVGQQSWRRGPGSRVAELGTQPSVTLPQGRAGPYAPRRRAALEGRGHGGPQILRSRTPGRQLLRSRQLEGGPASAAAAAASHGAAAAQYAAAKLAASQCAAAGRTLRSQSGYGSTCTRSRRAPERPPAELRTRSRPALRHP